RLQGRGRGRRTLVARPEACKSLIEEPWGRCASSAPNLTYRRLDAHVLTIASRLILLSIFPALLMAQSSVEFTGRYWIPQNGSGPDPNASGSGRRSPARDSRSKLRHRAA